MSNFPNCILRTSETNKLASETHIDPIIVTAKIASWQAIKGKVGVMPTTEEFKEYLSTQQLQNPVFSYTIQDALGSGKNLQIVKSETVNTVSSSNNSSEEGGAIITVPKEPMSVDQLVDSLEGTKTMILMERNGFTSERLRGLLLNEEDVEEFLIFTEISKLKNINNDPVRDMRFAWNQMMLIKTDFSNKEAETALSDTVNEGWITYAPKGKTPQEYNITKDIHGNWHIYNRQGEEVFKTKNGKSNKDRRLIFGQLSLKEHRAVQVEIGEDLYIVTNNGKIINMQTGQVISTGTSNPLTRLIRSKAHKLFNPDAEDTAVEEVEKGWKWARTADNSFEVSSQGTPLGSKFSAWNAKFAEGTVIEGVDVSGWSIEKVFQEVIKKSVKDKTPGKDSIVNIENYHPLLVAEFLSTEDLDPRAKQIIEEYIQGEIPSSELSKDVLEDFSYYVGYLPLWQKWAEQNAELISQLKKTARGKVLTDKFASTRVSQARALSEILNNLQSKQGRWVKRTPLPESATKWKENKEGSGYRSRTVANASWADITISFAPVTWSPGEAVTKAAAEHAGKGFLFFNPFESLDHVYDGEQIKAELEAMGLSTENIKLNIAGNSLHTVNEWVEKTAKRKGTEPHVYTQEEYDIAVQAILQSMLDAGITIQEVRTGGQTGADLAGSNAAYSLGIKNSVLAPKGWGFKNTEGKDIFNDYNSFVQRFKSWQDAHKEDTNKPWTRDSIAADSSVLYIFTDNTDRDSGSTLIDPESDYAKKYGVNKHYPTQTTAVARGLNNAMPISTQKHYHNKKEREKLGITVKDDNWKDSDAEEFERTIAAEIDAIIEKWNTGAFQKVKIPNGGFFNGKISNISKKRVPKLYHILQDQYKRLEDTVGKDNIEGGTEQRKAVLTLSMSDKYSATVERQEGVLKKEKEEGVEINAAMDALNKAAASYVSSTEGVSDTDTAMSPTARLAMTFSAQERVDRVEFLARRFSEILDGLVDEEISKIEKELAEVLQKAMSEGKNSALWKRYNELSRKNRIFNNEIKGRRWMMLNASKNGAKGLDAIFEMMKEDIEDFRDSEEDPVIVAKYQKILDNFDLLIKDACKSLENIEGFQVIPTKNTVTIGNNLTATAITDNGSEQTAEEKARAEEMFGDDEAGTSVASGNDGWSFKIRFIDPRTSLSKGVKKVLNSLLDVDYDQNPRLDDLGQPRYRNGEQSHAILLNELSDMIDADDFYDSTAEGYEKYPALNRVSERYPWVTQVMDALDEKPELLGSFFSDFNQAFISYWKHDSNGNPMPLNETVAKDAAMQNFIRNYEQSRQIDKKHKSIYTTGGTINIEAVKLAEDKIDELLHNENDLDVEDINTEAADLALVLRMMGMEAKDSYVKKLLQTLVLDAEEEINDDLHKLLSNVKDILSGVQDKERFLESSHLIDTFRSEFGEIARIAGEVTELDNLMSFREGDKTRYSYSAPNYAINIVKKFKSNARRSEFMQKEFADFPWFMQKGQYMSLWLDLLSKEDKVGEKVRDKLHLKEVISIGSGRNTKEYSDWSDAETLDVLINEYFSQGYNPKDDMQFAYYNFPIFADSPVAMFIRMPKFVNMAGKSFKMQLMPHYRNLVKQEITRISQILQRRAKMKELISEGKVSQAAAMEIQNFDKRGSKFCFFPELNNYKVREDIVSAIKDRVGSSKPIPSSFQEVTQLLIDTHNAALLNTVIDNAIEDVLGTLFEEFMSKVDLNSYVKNFISKRIITDEKNDVINQANTREALEEYFWNSTYASSQIVQITTTDLAFYKNGVDFQKRFKEVYAAGNRLNTNTKYGRKTERYLTLSDQMITSSNYSSIRQSLFQAVKEGRLTQPQAEAIANKFKNVNVADAQAFRSPYAMRAVLDMMGAWNKDMEESLKRFQEGNWSKVDFDIIWQTIKPFLFTNIRKDDGVGGALRVPHHNKNSEFVVLAAYTMVAAGTKNSAFYTGIGKFFEAHPEDIDMIQFESAVKVGGQGKINLNYVEERVSELLNSKNVARSLGIKSLADHANSLIIETTNLAQQSEEYIQQALDSYSNYDKLKIAMDDLLENERISQDNYNAVMQEIEPSAEEIVDILEECIKDPETGDFNIAEGRFNHNVVHEAPYSDYMIAQPTPEHLIDVDEATAGSQFRNLNTANLPDDFTMVLPGSDRELTKPEVLRLYRAAITDNLLDSYEEAAGIFRNIDSLHDRLIKLISDNPKYGDDLAEALEIITITNPITGESQRVFNLPLDMPSITNQIQELVTSTFKNKVTKQKIKGGNAILVANVGLTRELNVIRDPKTNNVIGVECYLPAWSKKFFKEFVVERTEINDNGEEVTYEEVDIKAMQEKCPELLKMIGYRIPTEDKYSMMPLIVKGFLPQQNGSSIMVAADVTTIAGSDFDVDKMFLRIPAFNKETLQKITYNINSIGDIADVTRDMTKEQRDNLMIDIEWAILTSKAGSEQMFNPGSFDKPRKMGRIRDITQDITLIQSWADSHEIAYNDIPAIFKSLEEATIEQLDDFLKGNGTELNTLTPQAFVYYHGQNMVGNALVGIYANGASIHTKMQDVTLNIIDDAVFQINGRTIQRLDMVENGLKESIQHNIAEFQNASVDNVKDPVLAKLLQNPNTADIMLFMIRAGISVEEASYLFSNPLLGFRKEHVYGIFKTLSKDYKFKIAPLECTSENMMVSIINSTYYKEFVDKIKEIGSKRLSSEEFFKQIFLLEDIINKNPELQANLSTFVNALFMHMQTYNHCADLADALAQGNAILKADSPNNAIDTSIAGAIRQERQVQLFRINAMDKQNFPFTGSTDDISDEFIKSGIVTPNMSREEMREVFLSRKLPSLQAFYSLGIELPIYVMSDYFIHGSKELREGLTFIMNNAFQGKMSTADIMEFFNGYIKYVMSEVDIFGDNSEGDFDTKRSYYLHTFPQKFMAAIENNPALSKNPTIRRLSHNLKLGSASYNAIELKRGGKTTPLMKGVIRRDFNTLLFNKDTVQFAKDLLCYAYYHDGFVYGPNSFGYYFDATYWSRFPSAVNAIRTIKEGITSEKVSDYIEQYLANNSHVIKYVGVDNKYEGASQITFATKEEKNAVASLFTQYGYQDYIRTQFGVFRLDPTTAANSPVYNKVPIFNSQVPVYNANSTVSEMSKLYYTQEGEETNVFIKYINERAEDAPSQDALLDRSNLEEEKDLLGNEDLASLQEDEVDQEMYFNEIQDKVSTIRNDSLRKTTAERLGLMLEEAQESGDTFEDLLPKLYALVDSAIAEDKGECNIPPKKHKYR